MERTFFAMGTEWWLASDAADAGLLQQAQALVEDVEARLSRFRNDSSLSCLNRDRTVDDAMLVEVLGAAEEARVLTAGAFDARAGSAVVAAGYDRSFELIATPEGSAGDLQRVFVAIQDTRVMLSGEGSVDLGGIAKGWTVDRVAALLAPAGPCIVDGGGDIAVRGGPAGGEWLIEAGDGLAVGLRDAAVATSSSLRRRWRCTDGSVAHHIVNPGDGRPALGVATAVVVARSTALADALATALVADISRTLPALVEVGADALLQNADGRWEMTNGMERYLR